jgi:hypothetical protein
LRDREAGDTLEKCMANKEIPGVIKARDEFDDVDLVFPWRTPFKITRELHGLY